MPGAEVGEGPSQPWTAATRDPRRLFGDLPNSSYHANSLGGPDLRELQQRVTLRDASCITRTRSSLDAERQSSAKKEERRIATTEFDTSNTYTKSGFTGGDEPFWRGECYRLQNKLASLKAERQRCVIRLKLASPGGRN